MLCIWSRFARHGHSPRTRGLGLVIFECRHLAAHDEPVLLHLSWTSLVPSLGGGEQFGGVVGGGGFGGEVLFTELDGEVLQRA